MEDVKSEFPDKLKLFFKKLKDYLDLPIYFYGSVQRNDYFPGKSDIDVDIFTDNETSTIFKLQHFLHINKVKIKKIIWRLNYNNRVVYGNKIMYKNEIDNFSVEFSIYNEKIKHDVLIEHNAKINLPFHVSLMLIILKFIHYDLHLMDKYTFRYIKKKLMTNAIGLPDDEFIVLKN
jgi:hypothetical protein